MTKIGFIIRVFPFFGCLALAGPAWSQSQDSLPSPLSTSKPETRRPLRQFVSLSHERISGAILGASDRLDSILGHDEYDDEVQGTRVRLRNSSTLHEKGDMSSRFHINSKLVLPRTQERFHLVLHNLRDRFAEDSIITNEDYKDNLPSQEEQPEGIESYSAALRFMIIGKRKLRAHTDAGVRFTIPLDPYVKAHFSQLTDLSTWEMRTSQHGQWYNSSGAGVDFRIKFDRPLGKDFQFRQSNLANWRENRGDWTLQNAVSLYHKLPYERVLSYFVSMSGSSEPTVNVVSYHWGVSFRTYVYEKWLTFELTPMMSYPREQNFIATPTINAQVEITFGDVEGG
jgi:hypothetical protein